MATPASDTEGVVPSSPFQELAPLTSALIGVYNHESFVAECLESVVNGSYKHLELIIFDDCSADRSDMVIRRRVEHHPKWSVTYVRHREPNVLAISVNNAIPLCRGEDIRSIAADDAMLPDGIPVRVPYLAQHPDKFAVVADCEVIDEYGTTLVESGIEGLSTGMGMTKRRLLCERSIASNLVFHWAVPGSVFTCRSEADRGVGPYDERLKVEDWDMDLRPAAVGRLGLLDADVARHRWFGGNASHNLGARMLHDQAMVARKHMRRLGLIDRMCLSAIYLNCLALTGTRSFLSIRKFAQHG